MKTRRNSLILALLAGASTFFAVSATGPDRGPLAWSAIALLGAAVVWNLAHLLKRSH